MRTWDVAYQLQVREAGGSKRSPGLHVSDIIRDLAPKSGILDKKWANVESMSAEKVELGIAWEERLARHHPEICFHPGEIVADDIPMTIDGITVDADHEPSIFSTRYGGALHEFKLTWKSNRKHPTEDWMWMCQDKCYLMGLHKAGLLSTPVVYQHVYWVNGNYSHGPDGGPKYQIYGIEFTSTEIKENWDMILAHKQRLEGKPLPRVNPRRR